MLSFPLRTRGQSSTGMFSIRGEMLSFPSFCEYIIGVRMSTLREQPFDFYGGAWKEHLILDIFFMQPLSLTIFFSLKAILSFFSVHTRDSIKRVTMRMKSIESYLLPNKPRYTTNHCLYKRALRNTLFIKNVCNLNSV